LHEKIATDDNMYTITIRYTLKGTVSKDRLKNIGKKLQN
jgi:hypothetical protein